MIRHTAPAAMLLGATLLTATAFPPAHADGFDYPFTCNQASLTADFAQRDALPHTETPPEDWYKQNNGHYLNGGWGPNAATLPPVAVPSDADCSATTWKQERILSAALHVVIYIDDSRIIDSRLDTQNVAGIQVRQREGCYRTAVLGGWRPIAG